LRAPGGALQHGRERGLGDARGDGKGVGRQQDEAFRGRDEAEWLTRRHHAQVVERHDDQQDTAQRVEPVIAFAHVLLVYSVRILSSMRCRSVHRPLYLIALRRPGMGLHSIISKTF